MNKKIYEYLYRALKVNQENNQEIQEMLITLEDTKKEAKPQHLNMVVDQVIDLNRIIHQLVVEMARAEKI